MFTKMVLAYLVLIKGLIVDSYDLFLFTFITISFRDSDTIVYPQEEL